MQQVGFDLAPPSGPPLVSSKGFKRHGTPDACDGGGLDDYTKTRDLGIVFLSQNLTVAQLPGVVPVYTSGDFLDRIFNFFGPPPPPGFFGGPLSIIGWGGNNTIGDNFTARHKGTPGSPVEFSLQCGFLGLGCEDSYTVYIFSGGVAKPMQGDSGGPITFKENGGADTIFGVFSALNSDLGNDRYWSPTWDNGEGNGKFIRQFMDDADDDGVNDAVDNCDPKSVAACSVNLKACVNPNQGDADGDGIGDACDNCPPSLCSQRGQPNASCSNPGQQDVLDGDGVGDACDNCPLKQNPTGQLNDTDDDAVGGACDNCNLANPVLACQGQNDCGGGILSCLAAPALFGRCTGGSPTACLSDVDCVGGSCVETGQWGRCTQQVDANGNGIGAPCDACDDAPAAALFSNSNIRAEEREGVMPRGDVCDEVPVFVSRALAVPSSAQGPFDAQQVTMFRSSAGIGSATATPHPPVTASVGFRHCNCFINGQAVSADLCFGTWCGSDPAEFDTPDQLTDWHRITTGTNGDAFDQTFPPKQMGLAQTLTRTFTGAQNFVDRSSYLSSTEHRRLGAVENVFWFTADDIAAGRVSAFNGSYNTLGFFWSHVPPSAATSARDAQTQGRLRDNYEYLQTPNTVIAPPLPGIQEVPCLKGPCDPWFRKDWLIQPIDLVTLPTNPLGAVPSLARLASHPSGGVVARGFASQPILDVSAGLAQPLKLLLQQPDVMWLTPVEAGIRGKQSGSANLVAVALPANWVQSDAPLVEVISTPQGLNTRTRVGPAFAAATTPRFIPGDRTDAKAVLSGTERAVYLVGGLRAGAPTGEIWRYDLDENDWARVLQPSNDIGPDDAPPPPSRRALPGRVLALGYHDVTGKLIAVDEQGGSGKGPFGKQKSARLLVFDFKTNTSRVALTVPRLGMFDDVRVVARETGTFVLVAARRAPKKWHAFEFAVKPNNTIQWLSRTHGSGLVLDDPINTNDGVLLPVAVAGAHDLITLDKAIFQPWPWGCLEL